MNNEKIFAIAKRIDVADWTEELNGMNRYQLLDWMENRWNGEVETETKKEYQILGIWLCEVVDGHGYTTMLMQNDDEVIMWKQVGWE